MNRNRNLNIAIILKDVSESRNEFNKKILGVSDEIIDFNCACCVDRVCGIYCKISITAGKKDLYCDCNRNRDCNWSGFRRPSNCWSDSWI